MVILGKGLKYYPFDNNLYNTHQRVNIYKDNELTYYENPVLGDRDD